MTSNAEINNFDIPKDASCDCSSSSNSNVINPAILSFSPGNGQIVIGKESRVYESHNFLVVGRQASTCDIRISHKSLSRQHAVLYYCTNKDSNLLQLFIKDLDTKLGTHINQRRLQSQEAVSLNNGDQIQFGKAQPIFTLVWNDQPTQASASLQEDQQISKQDEEDENEQEGPELTGRAQREAEIAKMMASLEDAPAYTKYKERPTNQPVEDNATIKNVSDKETQRQKKMIEKYKLPVTECTEVSSIVEDINDNASTSLATIAMDPTGARFAFGCRDSSLRLYDFAGAAHSTSNYRPFQNIYVEEGYPCQSITYSPTGDRLLVATTSIQPKIFDRDGNEILQFVRGDVYVRDPTKTIGHTAEITQVSWHPGVQKSIVHTCSRDGSWRTWNVDSGKLSFSMLTCQDVVIVKNLTTNKKTIPTCLQATPTSVVIGTECGSLQIYNYPITSKLRPQQSVILPTVGSDDYRTTNKQVHCVAVSVDSTKIATRTQSSVCVWDISNGKRLSSSSKPLLELYNLPHHPSNESGGTTSNYTTMAFSPNGKVLCVGVSEAQQSLNDKKATKYCNSIQLFAIPTFPIKQEDDPKKYAKSRKTIYKCALTNTTNDNHPLLQVSWHIKLNQILVTTSKEFVIWYDPTSSKKGVLLNSSLLRSGVKRKQASGRRDEDSLQELYKSRAPPPGTFGLTGRASEEIIVPNALPLFGGETAKTKRQRRAEKQELENSKQMPQKPSKDIYTTNNTLFAQLVMDTQGGKQKQIAGRDPREELQKYSEGKSYISGAYEGNKERILAEKTVEEEEDEMKNK